MNYIDNDKFYTEIVKRKQILQHAVDNNLPKPQISKYLCECIMLIANNFASRPNFYNYTYKEDLIGDAIENCILYFDKFDIEKSKNPFSYFTQITFYAFLRRIHKEKHQYYIKHKIIQGVETDEFELQEHDTLNEMEFKNSYRDFLKEVMDVELPLIDIKERKKRKQPEYCTIDALYED